MRLDPEASALINELLDEAHRENLTLNGAPPAAVAATFVDKLRHLEPFGHQWVGDYIHRLTTMGSAKVCADWRRLHLIGARTKRGKEVDVPEYAGAVQFDDAGRKRHVQMPLDYMDGDAILAHKTKLEHHRNTLSARIAVLDNLLATMEADPGMSTAEALERISA